MVKIMQGPVRSILFLVSSLLFVTASQANIAEFDEYWQKKAADAKAKSEAAFNPNPETVTNNFNKAVHRAFDGNSTRRSVRANDINDCRATNPIDRCWRCKANWATDRKALARCAKGFGRNTTGGLEGEFYVVTDPSDEDLINPKMGTLRYGVTRDRPLWIIFARDMNLRIQQEMLVTSNKTIDGRGANVIIAFGASFMLQFVQNIIIHGVHIHDIKSGAGGLIRDSETHYGIRTRSDGDGISIYGASNIWIDHVSMASCQDGLIDAIEGSTAITISNSHFTNHNDVMLFGASDAFSGDAKLQITVAFNHFGRGLVQRMPRCRWGFVHVVNNDYTHWLMYAIGGSKNPTIISQGNRYIAPHDAFAKEVTKREYTEESTWQNWVWRSENDLMVGGAFFVPSGAPFISTLSEKDFIQSKPGTFVPRLTRYSGALNCNPNLPC